MTNKYTKIDDETVEIEITDVRKIIIKKSDIEKQKTNIDNVLAEFNK